MVSFATDSCPLEESTLYQTLTEPYFTRAHDPRALTDAPVIGVCDATGSAEVGAVFNHGPASPHVEMWLKSLPLAPKSRGHIRGILSSLWNFAMWKQVMPMQVNPISLVRIEGASKRRRQPQSLTVEQFRFRHSYRMWIDAIGTPIGVQQKLMRHSDIRTTMNIYGDAATEDMREAHNKIVGLALQV